MKKGLGKGLGALIGSAEHSTPQINSSPDSNESGDKRTGVIEVSINKIEPNKDQPRKYFDEESLKELAKSIENFGVIQPLIVKDEGKYYSIVAGERRWRAARLANIQTIPIIVKDYSDLDVLQIALIENIQRQDLNPIEEAVCYKRLNEDYFFTLDDIGEKVGKGKSTISNCIKLLELDRRVQNFIIEGRITVGHGKNLLLIKDFDAQYYLADKIADDSIGVKESERVIKRYIGK